MNFLRLLPSATAALAIAVIPAAAQEKPAPAPPQEPQTAPTAARHPEKPLLWKVEGKDLAKPSYLFATVPVYDPVINVLHPEVLKAFTSSDSVYTEVSLDPSVQHDMIAAILRTDGKKLDQIIGEDLAKQLNSVLKAIKPDQDSSQFQAFKTWFVAALLPGVSNQPQGVSSLDRMLWSQAAAAGKKVSGLEKFADQTKGFSDLSEEEQITYLKFSLQQVTKARESGKNVYDELRAAYISGDPTKIEEEYKKRLGSDPEFKELREKLIQHVIRDRDQPISEKITSILKAEPTTSHFFAAGANRYCLPDGVRTLLEKAGYKVTRIE